VLIRLFVGVAKFVSSHYIVYTCTKVHVPIPYAHAPFSIQMHCTGRTGYASFRCMNISALVHTRVQVYWYSRHVTDYRSTIVVVQVYPVILSSSSTHECVRHAPQVEYQVQYRQLLHKNAYDRMKI
jgi:hypothetical protein